MNVKFDPILGKLREEDTSSSMDIESNYDSSNLQYMYTGTATPGSSVSSAVWKISRYDFTTGNILYADENKDYDNIYSNREALSYS